jgi:hypothetical protein
MLTRDALLPEYRDFLASINPSVHPTFNFGYPVSIEVGQGSLVHFFNRLQRGVHGRGWYKRNTDQPMIALGFWEHPDSNPHCHVVVAASELEWKGLLNNGKDCWLEQQKRGQLDFSKIESRVESDFLHHQGDQQTGFARTNVRLQSAYVQGVGPANSGCWSLASIPERVTLRHGRFIPTGPLNPKLPPLQTHRQAAAMRQKPPSAPEWGPPRCRSVGLDFLARNSRKTHHAETPVI